MNPNAGDDLARAVRGDRQALVSLFTRNGPLVRRRLAGCIPMQWQSVLSEDDVMQETYIDAFLDVYQFQARGEGSFSAWLMAIAKRNLLDAVRMLEADKRARTGHQVRTGANADGLNNLHEQLAWTRTTPSRTAARSESRVLLKRAIEQLPQTYRTVVLLYDLEGKPVKEVAAALGRSPGAVFMLRSRAHRLLSTNLGTASLYLSDTA